MKYHVVALSLLLAANPAFAQVPEGGDPLLENINEISFSGAPGVEAKAVLLSNPEAPPSLLIFHKKPGATQYDTIVDNNKLNLAIAGIETADGGVTVNPSGSLQIMTGNQTGPKRWERKLTISYRNGAYVVSGFTLSYQDSYTKKSGLCDYNLLTGKGERDGQPIVVKTRDLPLATLEDGSQFTSCEKW